jgi:hypothetical protein
MGGKYCIENDFAAQKELAEMERISIDEQWMARSELNALKLRAEQAEAKLATWQKDMNAVLRQRDDILARVTRLEEALYVTMARTEHGVSPEIYAIARRALEE